MLGAVAAATAVGQSTRKPAAAMQTHNFLAGCGGGTATAFRAVGWRLGMRRQMQRSGNRT